MIAGQDVNGKPARGPLLGLSSVSLVYGTGTQALSDLSLEIEDGSFVSFLGPSGCGKSTLLRLLAGLIAPTSGTIRRSETIGARGTVGFVFQEPTLMPWAPVERNVSLPLELLGSSRRTAEATVREVLDLVDLADFRKAYPRELSGGMKMRVSLARALVSRPGLLLLDEPFAALDEITRERLNNDLLRIWRERKLTVVFVTHSAYESAYLSDRIVVLSPRPGRIFKDLLLGSPADRDYRYRLTVPYMESCATVTRTLAAAMGVSHE